MPYEDTAVDTGKTKAQIEKLLKANGVEAVRFTSLPAVALIEFGKRKDKASPLLAYRLTLAPRIKSSYKRYPEKALDKAERQVLRMAYWWLKAKFEAIAFGLVEFEQEMLPYMLMQNQRGDSEVVAKIFFESMAGKLESQSDPFRGVRPMLTSGGEAKEA